MEDIKVAFHTVGVVDQFLITQVWGQWRALVISEMNTVVLESAGGLLE
jgi:hypothetical protein